MDNVVTGATRIVKTFTVHSGSVVVFNGYYDPSGSDVWAKAFTDTAKMRPAAAVWVKWNGAFTAPPTVKTNDQSGSNLYVTAAAATTSATDADGDGDPAGTDCDDNDASRYHGQVETPDDQIDMDCDGLVNPSHIVYRIPLGNSSYSPTLYDYSHGSRVYNMAYNSNGYYEVPIERAIAPSEFIIQTTGGSWDIGWDFSSGNSCVRYITPVVYAEGTNALYNVSQMTVPQYTTCHDVVTNLP